MFDVKNSESLGVGDILRNCSCSKPPCSNCGSMDHISGMGVCPAWVKGRWHCFYCHRKDIEVREHGAYHGCRDCIGDIERRFNASPAAAGNAR